MPDSDVIAAGAVVLSKQGVLLVHRPKYDDWSFPKGKLEGDELTPTCAVREVREETGLDVRLGLPLDQQRYPLNGGHKRVDYWVARVLGSRDVSGYGPNHEIDRARWVPADEARSLLTHPRDVATLHQAMTRRKKTRTLVVVRHGAAHQREGWRGDDRFRPLLRAGQRQAAGLARLLAAYDVRRLVSSTSTRCVETLLPYADTTGVGIEAMPALSEEGATAEGMHIVVGDLLAGRKRVAVCSHRPVLPDLFAAAGVEDPGLEPGETCVLHVRKGRLVATEHHKPRVGSN